MNRIASIAASRWADSSRFTLGTRSEQARKPLRVWLCAPTITLSRTDMVPNSARFWKVRPMPSRAMSWGLALRRSRSSKAMDPPDGW